nr:putative two-component system response regulator [Kibdelosporangium sp. MJ126-NF4]CTQ99174.1 putative two-component system response regulator [Kibdelosporangium sp. MJ126-NF4]
MTILFGHHRPLGAGVAGSPEQVGNGSRLRGDGRGMDDRCLVAAVDDHRIVLLGITHLLVAAHGRIRLGVVETSVRALLDGPGRHADVVLLDLVLPSEPDIAANVRRIREAGPRVVVHTNDTRPAVVSLAVNAGALGVVLKGDSEERLVEAVLAAQAGEFTVSSALAYAVVNGPRARIRLTARQREVLTLVARGVPQKVIARELGISVDTVPSHLRRIADSYVRAGVTGLTSTELAAQALVDGHIELGRDDVGD